MSGFFGLWIFYNVVWIYQKIPKDHVLQKIKYWILFFTLTEAGLGAKLVLSGLVGTDDSVHRSFYMSLHMLNSMALVASICWGLFFSSDQIKPKMARHALFQKLIMPVLILIVFICASGAVASLSRTVLGYSGNLVTEILKDFNPDSHYLIKVRGFHPIAGFVFCWAVILFLFSRVVAEQNFYSKTILMRFFVMGVFQMAFGIIALINPVWVSIKILHLLGAHLLWISFLQMVFWVFYDVQSRKIAEARSILFFDGVCNLCNGFVDFLIEQDTRFLLSSLQGQSAQKILPAEKTIQLKSLVLVHEQEIYEKSDAALIVIKSLNSNFAVLEWLLVFPKVLRDSVYDLIARNRYLIFGKRETCRLPTPQEAQRFLS
jgi:cytochrome c oxidase assembly protein subunit 15